MNLDGSGRKVFASGLRNPVGLAFHPKTAELYATVNERDGLGDDLPPDYFTRLRDGEFYGWPYVYFAPQNLDPRMVQDGHSLRPDLAARTRTPDVLFQTHSASLGLAFYAGSVFPEKYRQGAFVAFRGSWNRSRGTGYKIVFIPFDAAGRPKGWYEDFVTGFLLDPAGPITWGRPVGLLAMPDGSLLFTEEINGRIYRVRFSG
jgi:glucose/arabinose dehydrogenase